jgi:hypothetical protein
VPLLLRLPPVALPLLLLKRHPLLPHHQVLLPPLPPLPYLMLGLHHPHQRCWALLLPLQVEMPLPPHCLHHLPLLLLLEVLLRMTQHLVQGLLVHFLMRWAHPQLQGLLILTLQLRAVPPQKHWALL